MDPHHPSPFPFTAIALLHLGDTVNGEGGPEYRYVANQGETTTLCFPGQPAITVVSCAVRASHRIFLISDAFLSFPPGCGEASRVDLPLPASSYRGADAMPDDPLCPGAPVLFLDPLLCSAFFCAPCPVRSVVGEDQHFLSRRNTDHPHPLSQTLGEALMIISSSKRDREKRYVPTWETAAGKKRARQKLLVLRPRKLMTHEIMLQLQFKEITGSSSLCRR